MKIDVCLYVGPQTTSAPGAAPVPPMSGLAAADPARKRGRRAFRHVTLFAQPDRFPPPGPDLADHLDRRKFMASPTVLADDTEVMRGLSRLDRFLPVWIGLAMALGLLLGRTVPGLDDALDTVKIGQVSLPIALGLLLMMY